MSEKYEYIPVAQLKNRIFDLSDISVDFIKNIFLHDNIEVIYITEKNVLVGIITPGDLIRYYARNSTSDLINKSSNYINNKYTSIIEVNYKKVEEVFLKLPKLNEVPIVSQNILKGIIWNKKTKDENEWYNIRYILSQNDEEAIDWHYDIIYKFLKRFNETNIYIYRLFPTLFDCENSEKTKLLAKKVDNEIGQKYKYINSTYFCRMTENEHKEFFKELYNQEYIDEFLDDMSKLSIYKYNGIVRYSDIISTNFNVRNGYRITRKQSIKSKKIFFFGGCIWFGLFCDDDHTIPSYLCDLIGNTDYEVVNSSAVGFEGLYRMVTEKISCDDLAIVFVSSYAEAQAWERCMNEFSNIHINNDWIEVYDMENIGENLFNMAVHCNHVINERIAKVIYNDIRDNLSKKDVNNDNKREALQDYYISWGVVAYYKNFFSNNKIFKLDKNLKKGSIVMNCNPFTIGHRYLIEQASQQVDFLYVFVVEEDKSKFKFEDRLNMVKLGVQDLQNVLIIPSGKYIISQETFSQYFEKDSVTEINNMDYDIHIFAEVVAKQLDITCRFVGEEPFDKVTKYYNETMARILPAEGIEFIEIPRAKTEKNDVISASTVRRLISEKQYTKLSEYLPETTIQYIREHINSEI